MEIFKKITCQNCGGELIFETKTQLSICNFCGSEFTVRNIVDVNLEATQKIIPFREDAKDFEIAVLIWLSEGNLTPDDILESSIFSNQIGVYIPMWAYAGRYDGSWSGSSGYDRKEQYIAKGLDGKNTVRTRIVTDWRPSSGNCKDDFLFLACGNYDDFIPNAVKLFAECTPIENQDMLPFSKHYTEGHVLLELNLDKDSCWEKSGKKSANNYVESKTKQRMPGDKHKDLFLDVVYDINRVDSCFVPFWIVKYEYNGTKYSVYMDGINGRIQGIRPKDDSRLKLVKNMQTNSFLRFILVFVLGVILAGIFHDFKVPILFVSVILATITFIVSFSRIQKVMKASEKVRSEKLKQKIESFEDGNVK